MDHPNALRLLTSFAALALLMGACGVNDDALVEPGDPDVEDPDPDDEVEPDPDDEVEPDPSAEQVELQYTTYISGDTVMTQAVTEWLQGLGDIVDVDLNIEFFYGEALLAATDTIPGVGDGRADIGQSIALYHPAELPLSQVVGIPFVSGDMEAAVLAFNDLYEENDAFRAEYDALGVRVLTFFPTPGAVMGTSDAVESLTDFEGLSLRCVGLLCEALPAIGVNPVAMPAPEIYESVQRGVIDGHSGNPFEVLIAIGMHEVTPYMIDSGTGLFNLGVVVMNEATWEALPSEVQESITDSQDTYVREAIDGQIAADEEACDAFLDDGGVPILIPENEVDEWRETLGDDLVDIWRSSVLEAGVSEEIADEFFESYMTKLRSYEEESLYADQLPIPKCVEAHAAE